MKPNINVTPLIDVLLVLLIIFMVISPLKPSQFEAKIPSVPDKLMEADDHPHTLVVTINDDYSLELNKQKDLGTIEEPQLLSETLSRIFDTRAENKVFNETLASNNNLSVADKIQKTVFIKAPKRIPYGEVVKVIDVLKIAGANPISLQIDDLN